MLTFITGISSPAYPIDYDSEYVVLSERRQRLGQLPGGRMPGSYDEQSRIREAHKQTRINSAVECWRVEQNEVVIGVERLQHLPEAWHRKQFGGVLEGGGGWEA